MVCQIVTRFAIEGYPHLVARKTTFIDGTRMLSGNWYNKEILINKSEYGVAYLQYYLQKNAILKIICIYKVTSKNINNNNTEEDDENTKY